MHRAHLQVESARRGQAIHANCQADTYIASRLPSVRRLRSGIRDRPSSCRRFVRSLRECAGSLADSMVPKAQISTRHSKVELLRAVLLLRRTKSKYPFSDWSRDFESATWWSTRVPRGHHPTQFIHRSHCKRQHRKNGNYRRTRAASDSSLEAISRLQFKAVNAGLIAIHESVAVCPAQPTRTAVYGPVRTVVWQGSAGDRRPYAVLTDNPEVKTSTDAIRPSHK